MLVLARIKRESHRVIAQSRHCGAWFAAILLSPLIQECLYFRSVFLIVVVVAEIAANDGVAAGDEQLRAIPTVATKQLG